LQGFLQAFAGEHVNVAGGGCEDVMMLLLKDMNNFASDKAGAA
jgi:hypothetical protein